MKKNIILSILAFIFVTGYNANAQLGGYCPSSSPLTGDYEIPLNGNNFNFTDVSSTLSSVFIGYANCTAPT